jgi:hypothetical protein
MTDLVAQSLTLKGQSVAFSKRRHSGISSGLTNLSFTCCSIFLRISANLGQQFSLLRRRLNLSMQSSAHEACIPIARRQVVILRYHSAICMQSGITWLTEVLAYCSTYKLTGPARDRARTNMISSALTGNACVWYHTINNLPDCPNTFRGWILALHARFINR